MKTPRSILKDTVTTPMTSPPIRLVHAFREAVEVSKPEGDLAEEALAFELLMIASHASFKALSRLHDFLHQVTYRGEGLACSIDPRIVEDGFEVWLDATAPLVERLLRLEATHYESESLATFRKERAEALEFLDEARERRKLERQALRTGQLAALAAKLKPLQADYDDRGAVG